MLGRFCSWVGFVVVLGFCGASVMGGTLTTVGTPAWSVVDQHLFAAPLGNPGNGYADYIPTAQTILVPPELNVDLRGVGVMGSFDNSSIGAGAQGAPCGHHPRLLTVGPRRREAQEAPGTVPPRSTQPWIELFWTKAER